MFEFNGPPRARMATVSLRWEGFTLRVLPAAAAAMAMPDRFVNLTALTSLRNP